MGTTIRRDEALTVREIDGELLLLDAGANRIHQLNRTASFIWHQCGQGASPEGIASALAAEFEIDETTALNDVMETLRRFRSLDLLAPS